MATKVLTFAIPWSPPLNPSNPQAVVHTSDGWTLSVIKGSPHKQIDTVQKFVKVGVNTAHFGQFCQAMSELGPTKTVTVTYSAAVVSALDFLLTGSNVHINIPDP